jgi:hypothetical protein
MRELQGVVKSLASYTQDIAEGTARLLRAVQAHDPRIGNLEENLDQQ